MAKIGCVSTWLGVVSMLMAVIAKLTHWSPMSLGPRSFAAGAVLLLLLSIALHTCQSVCCSEAPSKQS
jgi:hypothetical protein